MDVANLVAEILKDLLLFVGAMVVLLVVLVVVIVRLPAGNRLKRILVALSFRIGAMLGAGLVAVPLEPIPGVDVAYDATAVVGLLIYWITFFATVIDTVRGSKPRPRN